jgi:SAM-dependent methyltransferase
LSLSRIEQWNERYRAGEQAFETPSPLVVEFTSGLAPGAALDLACGAGRNALNLADNGWRVTAIDGSPVAVGLLLDRASKRELDIDTRVIDLESGGLDVADESYDLVLSCYYLQRSLVPRMKSALCPGGLLIMIVHLADADEQAGTPTRACPGELRNLFHGWQILHYREGDPSESCHRRAVAELVAAKPAA